MTRRRLMLSDAQRAELAAASATLRLADRATFVHDVRAALDREPTNDDVAAAIEACVGITPIVTHAYLCDGVPDKQQTNQRTKPMNRKDHEIIGRDGRSKRVPPDYLLQDGERLRVSLRDSAIAARTATDASGLNAVQRAVRDAALLRDGVAFHDGAGHAAGHRPGYCFSTDAELLRRRELAQDAYAERARADSEAWRNPGTAFASDEARRVRKTTRDPRGRLLSTSEYQYEEDELNDSGALVRDDREAAYAEVEERARNAWRTPR